MRLANNDDYFETLKILSRANVPFGEAGSFPTQQQQSRPFSPSSSLLRPSDSASQMGARPASVSSNFDTCPSVRAGASAGWASASSLRPTTSSGVMCGSPYGAVSSYFGQVSVGKCQKLLVAKFSAKSVFNTGRPHSQCSSEQYRIRILLRIARSTYSTTSFKISIGFGEQLYSHQSVPATAIYSSRQRNPEHQSDASSEA